MDNKDHCPVTAAECRKSRIHFPDAENSAAFMTLIVGAECSGGTKITSNYVSNDG